MTDSAAPAGPVRVIKLGAGPLVVPGDLLVLHLRLARGLDDLQDDARVIASTYAAGDPVRVRYDPDVLLPEVFSALAGMPAGSTVVVNLGPDALGPSTGGQPDTLLLEIWVQEAGRSPADDVEVLASREVVTTGSTEDGIASALRSARSQLNGYVVSVEAASVDRFVDVCRQVGSTGRFALPKRLGSVPSDDARVSYLLSTDLFAALSRHLQEREGDEWR